MRTTLSIPENDICQLCDNNHICPENIYDCMILNEAINNKTALYIWCWVKKPDKKK